MIMGLMPLLGFLFATPLKLPAGGRLWMFFPLALAVSVVYRATRSRTAGEMPLPTLVTFAQIVLGMIAIAVAFYVVNVAALRWG
jgi:hypothetical protein